MKKFENLGRMLSKEEQKRIMGGDPPGEGQCGETCSDTTVCTQPNGENGHCHKPDTGPNAGKCFCVSAS